MNVRSSRASIVHRHPATDTTSNIQEIKHNDRCPLLVFEMFCFVVINVYSLAAILLQEQLGDDALHGVWVEQLGGLNQPLRLPASLSQRASDTRTTCRCSA